MRFDDREGAMGLPGRLMAKEITRDVQALATVGWFRQQPALIRGAGVGWAAKEPLFLSRILVSMLGTRYQTNDRVSSRCAHKMSHEAMKPNFQPLLFLSTALICYIVDIEAAFAEIEDTNM